MTRWGRKFHISSEAWKWWTIASWEFCRGEQEVNKRWPQRTFPEAVHSARTLTEMSCQDSKTSLGLSSLRGACKLIVWQSHASSASWHWISSAVFRELGPVLILCPSWDILPSHHLGADSSWPLFWRKISMVSSWKISHFSGNWLFLESCNQDKNSCPYGMSVVACSGFTSSPTTSTPPNQFL